MFGLTTTRRLRAEVADAKAEARRQRQRAETAEQKAATAKYNREQALRQSAELEGRLLELGKQLARLAEADSEHAAGLEQRVARQRRVGARILAAYAAECRRADLLQARLDDACGLNDPAVTEGRYWQGRRHDTKGLVS